MSVIPLFGYEATGDLESLSLYVIMHILFPAAFIISQLLKFRFTDSWRANRVYLISTKANFLPPKTIFLYFPFSLSASLHFFCFPPPPPLHFFCVDVGVNVFLPSLMRFLLKKRPNWSLPYYSSFVSFVYRYKRFIQITCEAKIFTVMHTG